ncbi:MAG TPA: spore cortex biosynthesis protein YabQ [Paenibacillaceae bacterium]
MSTALQWTALGAVAACGAGAGLMFDLYRTATSRYAPLRRLIPALDVLFGILSAVLVFRVLLAVNHGQLRMYVFLGLAAGLAAYFALLSPAFLRVASGLFAFAEGTMRALRRLAELGVLRPLGWSVRALARLADLAFLLAAALAVGVARLVLALLKPPAVRLARRMGPAIARRFPPSGRIRRMLRAAGRVLSGLRRLMGGKGGNAGPEK